MRRPPSQPDLFSRASPGPTWHSLPAAARETVTPLIARLLSEHRDHRCRGHRAEGGGDD